MKLLRNAYLLFVAAGASSLGFMALTAPPSIASAADAPAPRDPQAIWDKLCKSCHGTDGKGNPEKAKTLKIDATLLDLGRPGTEKLTRDEHKQILLEGKEKMPAYKSKVKAEEVDPLLDLAAKIAEGARTNR